MSYYLVRIGEGSKYVEEGRKGGFIGIGYGQVPDLQQFKNADEIKEFIANHNTENLSSTKININTGRLSCFAFDMQAGDTVISPIGGGEYIVGTVGNYYFGYC